MDPIAAATGTALVGAMASDGWPAARAEMVAFWRRVRAEDADAVAGELTEVRAEVLAARRADDPVLERSLAGTWQLRVRELVGADTGLAGELRLVLDEHLVPTLTPDERDRVVALLRGTETDRSGPGGAAART